MNYLEQINLTEFSELINKDKNNKYIDILRLFMLAYCEVSDERNNLLVENQKLKKEISEFKKNYLTN